MSPPVGKPAPSTPRQVRWALGAILLLGLALRLPGILWGFPALPFTGQYHPDELATYGHAVGFPGNYLTSTSYVHGSSVPYLVAAVLLPVKLLVAAPTWSLICLMAMRLTSVAMGTTSVWLVFRLGRRFYGDRGGLVAAALLAVAIVPVMNSSFATPDVTMGALLLASALAANRAFETGRVRDALAAGALAGLLLGTKVTMAILFVIPIVLALAGPPTTRLSRRLLLLAVLVAVAGAVFALTNIHVVLRPSEFLQYWREQKYAWYDRSAVPFGEVPGVWWRQSVVAVGLPTMWLFVVGVPAMGRRDLRFKLALLLFLAIYFMGLRHYVLPRFVASVAPIVCLFAAAPCAWLLARSRPWSWMGAAAAAAAMCWGLWYDVAGIRLRLRDPRTRAARFMARSIPPGSTLGVATPYPEVVSAWEYPRMDNPRWRRIDFLQHPDFVVVSSISYDLMAQAVHSPKLGKNYTWDPSALRDWYQYRPPSPEVFKFFAKLVDGSEDYVLYQSFEPPSVGLPVDFAGIGVRIYARAR